MAPAGRFRVKGTLAAASFCSILLLGCANPSKFKQPARPDGKYLVHVVSSPGENLAQISEWYADGAKSQKAIAAANAGRDLGNLQIGDRVLIPFAVVKKLDPLGPGLPRPRKSEDAAVSAVEESAPAGAALDDDFVDMPDEETTPAPAPTTPTASTGKRSPQPQRSEAPKEVPKGASRPEAQRPGRPLDPLEELAASAEKAQREQPAGVPVGVQPQAADLETFDEVQGAVRQSQKAPQPVAPADEGQAADGDVEQLRRELGLTQ